MKLPSVRITPMSAKGRVIQVVQTSPPQISGALWSSDNLTGFVYGGDGFTSYYVSVSPFDNISLFSQVMSPSQSQLSEHSNISVQVSPDNNGYVLGERWYALYSLTTLMPVRI